MLNEVMQALQEAELADDFSPAETARLVEALRPIVERFGTEAFSIAAEVAMRTAGGAECAEVEG